ncbi:hypothetical protein BLOT_000010 [Blomia tropicalis]|nr:hypothetical protein BLOT_000010 [Blomia tropicalis]
MSIFQNELHNKKKSNINESSTILLNDNLATYRFRRNPLHHSRRLIQNSFVNCQQARFVLSLSKYNFGHLSSPIFTIIIHYGRSRSK